jgi:hypothetical protein
MFAKRKGIPVERRDLSTGKGYSAAAAFGLVLYEVLEPWKNKGVGSLFLPHAIADNLDAALGQFDDLRGCVKWRGLSP